MYEFQPTSKWNASTKTDFKDTHEIVCPECCRHSLTAKPEATEK